MGERSGDSLRLVVPFEAPIDPVNLDEVSGKLAYVDPSIVLADISMDGTAVTLELREPCDREAIARKTRLMVAGMTAGRALARASVLESHLRPIRCQVDPMPELAASGDVFAEAPGIFSLGPKMASLVGHLDSLLERMAGQLDARPYRFPALIPARFLEKVDYFSAFPHSLSFVTHLREDFDVIERFSKHARCEDDSLRTSPADFAEIATLLSPAVCYHLYYLLSDTTVPPEGMVATTVGSCFRYESINLCSLERLWNFTMREVILVGPPGFVAAGRERLREMTRALLEQLEIAYTVETANDPFFIGESRKQAIIQTSKQLKLEIRAPLPYAKRTLAVGSFNYHTNFFGRKLEITAGGEPAHTGCAAFGLERLALAFVAQHGTEPAGWPECVRSAVAAAGV